MPKQILINWLILSILGLIWGASFFGVELALRDFKPISVAAGRVTIAAIILLGITLSFGEQLPKFHSKIGRRIWCHCIGMGVFTNALPFSLLSWGQQMVTSSFAGLCMAIVPLIVLPLSHFFVPGESLTKIKVLGFSVGFFGVFLLFSGNKFISDSGSSLQMLGSQFACIVASLCYAIGSIITRLCPPVGTLPYATSGLLVGAIILLPLAILLEETPMKPQEIALAGLFYLSVFPTAIATLLLTALIRRAGPPFLSLVNYQVPIWAMIIGVFILDENLPSHFFIALGIILFGLFLSQSSQLVATAQLLFNNNLRK